jgi:hypothetical protein
MDDLNIVRRLDDPTDEEHNLDRIVEGYQQ